MSRLAIISGLDNTAIRNVGNSGIDIAAWTPAENHLMAVKRALQIDAAYYGDSDGTRAKGIAQVENAIYGKVSSFNFLGIQSPKLDAVNRNIAYAKSLIKSTDTLLIDQFASDEKFASFGQGINTVTTSLPALSKEKWIINFFRIKELYRTDINTSEAVIKSVTNDYKSVSKDFIARYVNVDKAISTFGLPKNDPIEKIWKYVGDQFNSFALFRSGLYSKFEPTGHHVLYEFMDNYLQENATTQSKRLNHKQALDVISKVAQIDRATMTLWTSNGINARYVNSYNEPIGGLATIQALKDANKPKVGLPFPVILGAITAALAAANQLLITIKGTPEGDYMGTVNSYATETNSPNVNDFPYTMDNGNAGNTNQSLMKYLPYALIGAGALYFISQKK